MAPPAPTTGTISKSAKSPNAPTGPSRAECAPSTVPGDQCVEWRGVPISQSGREGVLSTVRFWVGVVERGAGIGLGVGACVGSMVLNSIIVVK